MNAPSQRERVAGLLREGIRPQKRLGQHFLTDAHIARRIVEAIGPLAGRTIVEIGPGLGALTELLIGRVGRLIGVELDARFHRELAARFQEHPEAAFHHGDILRYDFARLPREIGAGGQAGLRRAVAIGAIPYQITSPLVLHLMEHRAQISDCWLVMQREVAQRISAPPGAKDYGRLTCAVQYRAVPRLCFTIPPRAFTPPPAVDSALIHLAMRRQPAVAVRDEAQLFAVIAAAFGHRRKTLLNSVLLAPAFRQRRDDVLAALAAVGLDPTQRGETVSLEQFAALADRLTS